MNLFVTRILENPAVYVPWVLLVAFSICIHEFMHAYTAHRLGDDTAAESGHLTLNPLVQMGWISLVMLLLIGIAWGSVPVNPSRLRGRYASAAVSFAGPLSNLVLCALFGLFAMALRNTLPDSPLVLIMSLGSLVNGALFVLNMIPAPPLDGWSILSDFVPALKNLSPQVLSQMSWFLLLLIFMTNAFSFVWSGGAFLAGLFGARL